ncbi:MAG TPA: N-acetylmuramoyl-L-alanine amidase [Longimicrobiales bacterium]|nr:N-acetylmuramoyl-L-alanine amidase [Longimicrobiales bacterium]
MCRTPARTSARTSTRVCAALLLCAAGACASASTPAMPAPEPAVPVPGTPAARRVVELPAIPLVDGPLHLEVGYPAEGATLAVRDSNFIFGSTGSGRAGLTINGRAVDVAPNGGFLAFIAVPADGVYRLHVARGTESLALERTVRLPPAPAAGAAAARITSVYPTGAWAFPAGEVIELGFRGPAGGRATLILPDGRRVPLAEQGAVLEGGPGDEFRADLTTAQRAAASVRYAARITLSAPLLSRDTAVARPRIGTSTLAPAAVTDAVLELVTGTDTTRAPLRLNVSLLSAERPRVGIVTAPAGAAADWLIRGRHDVAGPFQFFWPPGTRLTITGERDNMYRVRLVGSRNAWVPAGDVRLLAEGATPPAGPVASVRFSPQSHWIDLRIPLPDRLPYEVIEDENTLHVDVFGAVSRINFFQYGGLDPLITRAEWTQPADSVLRVTVKLAQNVWGYVAFFDAAGALVVRIRRPPAIDPDAPLRNLLIAVNAGHGGSDRSTRGPTGLTEADANLYISQQLRDLLQREGAQVVMIRDRDTTVALGDRPRIAVEAGAHLFVSIHNNAFPDGVNPWTNNGTSVYYYYPHAADLARVLQRELLDELGLRDIGYGRADLSDARITWMPSVLTETMFMMIPQQEAALKDPAVQERIAAAHVRALRAFVLQRKGY